MPRSALANPYLTNELSPPSARSYRYQQWVERGYQTDLRPIDSDSELGVMIGQMGWVGSHAHANGYLWASAGNMGTLLSEAVDEACLLPRVESPRYALPPAITVKGLAGQTRPFNKVRLAVGHDRLGTPGTQLDNC